MCDRLAFHAAQHWAMIRHIPVRLSWMAKTRNAQFIILLGLLGLIIWNVYAYLGVNWELLETKHYFDNYYYGGFTETVYDDGNGLTTFMEESTPCLSFVDSFLNKTGGAGESKEYSQPHNVDRIFTCGFLPSLVARLGFSKIKLT